MRSDPRVGMTVSLGLAGIGALWLLAQVVASDALFDALGTGVHAITMLSIFALLAGGAVALLFRSYGRVKADLLAGRNVLARWTVDPATFKTVGAAAEERERGEKRGALYLIFFFVAVIFGGFVLYDPASAPFLLSVAALLVAAVSIAFWLGNRTRRQHLEFQSDDIIVGKEGLLVNGVLHVWSAAMASLSGAKFSAGPPASVTVHYSYPTRAGMQYVTVALPVPPEQVELARTLVEQLGDLAGRKPGHRRARRAQAAV
jgi:hypothetical protein